jgi:hypothetical protein
MLQHGLLRASIVPVTSHRELRELTHLEELKRQHDSNLFDRGFVP